MLKGLILGLLILAVPAISKAQVPVVTDPSPTTSVGGNVSGTIVATGVYQQLWPAANRKGCTIINYSASNSMHVTEGYDLPSSINANAVTLPPEDSSGVPRGVYYCQVGNSVLTGEINITGTAGDAYYAAQY